MSPPSRPPSGRPGKAPILPVCRYPRCNSRVFFDDRVNELREWCSDDHMLMAIMQRVEKPCQACQVWPRRNGKKFCSGNVCGYQ